MQKDDPRAARWMLPVSVAVTAFVCGWLLMSMEIVGGRMLTPYFGSGVYVWGSVISVFLLGLSAGYMLGGVLSAKRPDGRWLAALVLAAGISVLPVTAWHGGVCEFLADSGMSERWAALSAALVLFLVPCALLGAVSPFAVRLVAREVSTVGLSAGTLYAISTVGSFLGTLLTSFYVVLWWGLETILLAISGSLIACACTLYVVWALLDATAMRDLGRLLQRRVPLAGAAFTFLLLTASFAPHSEAFMTGERESVLVAEQEAVETTPDLLAAIRDQSNPTHAPVNWSVWDGDGYEKYEDGEEDLFEDDTDWQSEPPYEIKIAGAEDKVLFRKSGLYHNIIVAQTGDSRYLKFRNRGGLHEESVLNLKNPTSFELRYYELVFAAFAHVPEPHSILFIGLGAGTVPMAIHTFFPHCTIDAVELDPDVVYVARRFFGLKEDERFRVFVRDGRVQVRDFIKEARHYDIVMVDAFRGGYIPYHLTTMEFLSQVIALLAPDGVIAFNLRPGFRSYEYQVRTIAHAFRNSWKYGDDAVVIVADMREEETPARTLHHTAQDICDTLPILFDLSKIVRSGERAFKHVLPGPVLTDDFAPADVLREIPE